MAWARKAAPFVLVLGLVFGIAQGAYSQGLIDRLLGRGQSYEDCILENMRGVTSDLAAREVRRACQQKDNDRQPQQPPRNIVDVTGLIRDIGGESIREVNRLLRLRLYHNTPNINLVEVFINYGPPGRQREFRCRVLYEGGMPGRTSEYYCGEVTHDVLGNDEKFTINKMMGYRQ